MSPAEDRRRAEMASYTASWSWCSWSVARLRTVAERQRRLAHSGDQLQHLGGRGDQHRLPLRIIRCGAVEAREWIGPGTAISGRPHSSAQPAVFRAPDRRAASTTIVPCAIAAISRFRARNRTRVGCDPGGSSDTSRCSLSESVEHPGVGRRVGHVHPVGHHADRRPAGRQRATVRRRIDPERPPGDDRDPLARPDRPPGRPPPRSRTRWPPASRRWPPTAPSADAR